MKPIRWILGLTATLAAVVVVLAQTFPTTEPFRITDTLSGTKAKLVQSGVTVAGLSKLSVLPTVFVSGLVNLTNGVITVANTNVSATSRIFLTKQTIGTGAMTNSVVSVSGTTNGASFSITSTVATDTNTVAYLLVQP